jgi:hypothetical protein
MPKITKILAPNNDGLYLICIDGHPVGYPISEEAANAKIEHLSRPSDYISDELAL